MTKRELQKQIDELKERVRELEARPMLPPIQIPGSPYQPQRYGTGDPLPEPPYRVTC
jgi:hypothetical protein